MADDKLRQLERRWRASDAIQDKEAWLRERVRCGELDRETVRAAAYLGCPVSARVMPGKSATELEHLLGLKTDPVRVRTGLALARQALPLLEEDDLVPFSAGDEVIVASLATLEDWSLDPGSKTKGSVTRAGKALHADCMSSLDFRSDEALKVMVLLGLTQSLVAPRLWDLWQEYVLDRVLRREGELFVMVVSVARSISRSGAAGPISEAEVLRAVCFELVPWLLGVRDPVRERIDAR